MKINQGATENFTCEKESVGSESSSVVGSAGHTGITRRGIQGEREVSEMVSCFALPCFVLFAAGSHDVTHSGLKLMMILSSWPPEC